MNSLRENWKKIRFRDTKICIFTKEHHTILNAHQRSNCYNFTWDKKRNTNSSGVEERKMRNSMKKNRILLLSSKSLHFLCVGEQFRFLHEKKKKWRISCSPKMSYRFDRCNVSTAFFSTDLVIQLHFFRALSRPRFASHCTFTDIVFTIKLYATCNAEKKRSNNTELKWSRLAVV